MSRSYSKLKLAELIDTYVAHRPGLKVKSAMQYRHSAAAFERYLERPAKLGDLNEETILRFVSWRLARWSPRTAKRDRTSLVTFWRFAARKKLLPDPPFDGVPNVKVPRKNATAWTLGQLEKLLAACESQPGRMRAESDPKDCHWDGSLATGTERSKWWTSLVLFLFDSGCRISAALEVTPADIDLDQGFVTLRGDAAKTGLEQLLQLSPQTVAAIREIYDPQAKRVWMYCYRRRKIWTQLESILKQAGLPHDRYRKFHALRRTCASLTAAAGRFDLAQRTLGHTTPTMTSVYVDQRALPVESAANVLPRPVFGNGPANQKQPQQTTEKPDAAAMLAAMSPEDLATLMRLAKAMGVAANHTP